MGQLAEDLWETRGQDVEMWVVPGGGRHNLRKLAGAPSMLSGSPGVGLGQEGKLGKPGAVGEGQRVARDHEA